MSSVLGPVHETMYEKIKCQDRLTAILLTDQPELAAQLDRAMPPVVQGEIAELIDSPNIHGWLAARIDVVEARLAFALAHARSPHTKLYDYGRQLGEGKHFSDYKHLFLGVYAIILDGMPCDGAISAVMDGEGRLVIRTDHDLHAPFEANPLATDPSLSLSKTCDGHGDHDHEGHDHDHHHQMTVAADTIFDEHLTDSDGYAKASRYHKARLHLLRGYLHDSGAEVEMINAHDYRITMTR